MKPTIGIPQCLDIEGRIRSGREYLYIDIAYARSIERAGGIPIHLPVGRDVSALVAMIDGLLLPGGDDFLPATPYPEDVAFEPAPESQIQFDSGLLAGAIERDLPLLGICYGAQLIALHFGGSLHHHIPLDVPAAQNHQLPEDEGRHDLVIESNTRLASLVGPEHVRINSLHHQAVAEVGPELAICARAPDGIIEAFEHRRRPFCIGVQWHPEKLHDGPSGSLFTAFVDAARESAPERIERAD